MLFRSNMGTTFGGGPLAMRAGIETLRILEEDGLLANATRVGEHLRGAFKRALADVAGVKDVRGLGLMIGIELDRPCGVLVQRALDAGLLINVTRDQVIRLLPPLIMSTSEADQLVAGLVPLIQTFLRE